VSRLELPHVEGDRPSPDAPAPGGAGGALGLGEARNELAKVHHDTVDEGENLRHSRCLKAGTGSRGPATPQSFVETTSARPSGARSATASWSTASIARAPSPPPAVHLLRMALEDACDRSQVVAPDGEHAAVVVASLPLDDA
jgi:hypothetical protein